MMYPYPEEEPVTFQERQLVISLSVFLCGVFGRRTMDSSTACVMNLLAAMVFRDAFYSFYPSVSQAVFCCCR